MTDALLRLDRVNSFYGPVQVHFDLSLEVPRGQIVCLLGGNASGKSTSMKVILGLLKPRSGEVIFDGSLAYAVGDVAENVLMGAYTRSDAHAVAEDYERILDLFPKLRERHAQQAGTLSGGEQQMVAMARALMGRPRLIVMDEPTMGLSPLHVDRVLEMIQTINRQGVSVFMVEQNASLALQIAHRGYVLQTGRIVLSGAAADLARDPQIRDAYLGGAQAA